MTRKRTDDLLPTTPLEMVTAERDALRQDLREAEASARWGPASSSLQYGGGM